MELEFFRCKHCGQIIKKVKDTGVSVICCGDVMEKLIPNTTDAAKEKHVPVISVEGNVATVTVSTVSHPMQDVLPQVLRCAKRPSGRMAALQLRQLYQQHLHQRQATPVTEKRKNLQCRRPNKNRRFRQAWQEPNRH